MSKDETPEKVKAFRLNNLAKEVTKLHADLKAGAIADTELLSEVVNAMLNFLHDIVQAVETKNTTVNGTAILKNDGK